MEYATVPTTFQRLEQIEANGKRIPWKEPIYTVGPGRRNVYREDTAIAGDQAFQ